MSNNPNFHNRYARPVFNHVYQGDDDLCYDYEKLRAIIGYFSTSSCAEKFDIPDNNYGEVCLHVKGKYAIVRISSSSRRIMIAPADKNYEVKGSFYNYEFYLRHTIDKLIIGVEEKLVEILELDSAYQLWM